MTKENLLKPRAKAIFTKGEHYPGSPFSNNEIIELEGVGSTIYYDNYGGLGITTANYPHLFKILEWWEDRNIEDLPVYLKEIEGGKIFKVTRYFIYSQTPCYYTGQVEKKGKWKGVETPFNLRATIPATEAEYLSSITLIN
jgi:hypothetical protein